MPKITSAPSCNSPVRAALAQAHADLAEARQVHAQASDAADAADRANWHVLSEIEHIQKRIAGAKDQRVFGVQTLEQYHANISKVAEPLEAVLARAPATQAAVDAAKTELSQADWRMKLAEKRVNEAVTAVLQNEAAPAIGDMLKRIRQAQVVMLELGPHLEWFSDRKLVDADDAQAVQQVIELLRLNPVAWPGYQAARQRSVWRAADELLRQSSEAPLPAA